MKGVIHHHNLQGSLFLLLQEKPVRCKRKIVLWLWTSVNGVCQSVRCWPAAQSRTWGLQLLPATLAESVTAVLGSRENTDSGCFSSLFKAVKAPRALKFWSSVLFPYFYNPWKWGGVLCEGKLGEFICLLPTLARVVCTCGGWRFNSPSTAERSSLALTHRNNKLNLPTPWPAQLCCNEKQSNSACCNFIIRKEKEISLATRYLLQK